MEFVKGSMDGDRNKLLSFRGDFDFFASELISRVNNEGIYSILRSLCFLHFRFPTVHNTERYISMTKVCFFGRTDRRLLLVNTSILRRNKSSVNTNSVFSYFWQKLKKFLQCDFACKKISKNWKKHVFADFFKKFYPLQIARLTQVEIGFPKKQCFAFLDRDQRFK